MKDVVDFGRLVEEDLPESNNLIEENVPRIGSPEWQDYVLNQLFPDEYVEKNEKKLPKVNGLRRVAQKVLGPIISSLPVSVTSNGNTVTVIYKLEIAWKEPCVFKDVVVKQDLDNSVVRVFAEVADAGPHNTPNSYLNHLPATASSRAEGRALRKALQLNIVTAEEMSGGQTEEASDIFDAMDEDPPCTENQKYLITKSCKDLKIDLNRFLLMNDEKDFNFKKSKGQELIGRLNIYRQNNPIPKEILSGS